MIKLPGIGRMTVKRAEDYVKNHLEDFGLSKDDLEDKVEDAVVVEEVEEDKFSWE